MLSFSTDVEKIVQNPFPWKLCTVPFLKRQSPYKAFVFNKIDRLFNEEKDRCKRRYPNGVFVSAKEHMGLDVLKNRLRDFFFS